MSRFRPTGLFAVGLVAALMLMSEHIVAQTSGVTLRGSVSETVVLSVSHVSPPVEVVSNGNRVDITFSNGGVIRLPLLVRSNSGFKLTALLDSKSPGVSQVLVTEVRATGSMVSPQAVRDINIERGFDARGVAGKGPTDLMPFPGFMPLTVLSGPRISLGGTLVSPGNALEVVLLIRLKSESGPTALTHLTLLATPESRIP